MSNKISTVETSTPSEAVEQGHKLAESASKKDAGKNVQQNMVEGGGKENKTLEKDIRKNGKTESPLTAKNRKKRKFPSREEISRAR